VKPIRFYLTALIIILADQLTKWVIVQKLPLGASRPALGNILVLTHTRNTGGAFSLLPAGNAVFIGIAFFATLALIYAYHKYQQRQTIVSAALALALGGAIGNLVDRLRFHYVVDFFDFHGWTNHTVWPIFNVADSAISVGIFLLALHFLFTKEEVKKPEPSQSEPPTEDSASPSANQPSPQQPGV
jgi:signal peptidase II